MLGRVFDAEVRARQRPTLTVLQDTNKRSVFVSMIVCAVPHPRARVAACGWRRGLVSSAALARRVCTRREDESVDIYIAQGYPRHSRTRALLIHM